MLLSFFFLFSFLPRPALAAGLDLSSLPSGIDGAALVAAVNSFAAPFALDFALPDSAGSGVGANAGDNAAAAADSGVELIDFDLAELDF